MTEPVTLSLIGADPGLAAVLAEHAPLATPPFRFVPESEDAALVLYSAADKAVLAAHLRGLKHKNSEGKKIALLVLAAAVPEPEEDAESLGLAGIFRAPVRLAALLDAGFSALRLARLKAPRLLGAHLRFNPFTRMLEDTRHGTSETLTPKEADLLLALLEAGSAGLPRQAALTQLWGYHREVDSHAVETAAWRLRRKLETLSPGAASLESREAVFYLAV